MLERVKRLLIDSTSGELPSEAKPLKLELQKYISELEEEGADTAEIKIAFRLLCIRIADPEVVKDRAFLNKVSAL